MMMTRIFLFSFVQVESWCSWPFQFFQVVKVDPVEVVETVRKEEHQDKDTVDLSSRCPSHLAHLRPSTAGDSPVVVEENDSDTCILSKGKMCSLNIKQSQVMAALSRTKHKVREETANVVEDEIESSPRGYFPISPSPYPANGWPFSPASLLQAIFLLAEAEEL